MYNKGFPRSSLEQRKKNIRFLSEGHWCSCGPEYNRVHKSAGDLRNHGERMHMEENPGYTSPPFHILYPNQITRWVLRMLPMFTPLAQNWRFRISILPLSVLFCLSGVSVGVVVVNWRSCWFLIVVCWLSVSVVSRHFRCRYPALSQVDS
jgi:hypothetical protein